MTVLSQSSQYGGGLSARSPTPLPVRFTARLVSGTLLPTLVRLSVLWWYPPQTAMTESPFALIRRYLNRSSVNRYLNQRYPVLIAPTGSCAAPRSSAPPLLSLEVAVLVGCCEPLLEIGASRRYPGESFPGCLDPCHGGLQGALTRFFPRNIGLPQVPMGRLPATLRSTTSKRRGISRLQPFVYLQASRFAATQVVPTAVPLMHWAAVAFTSEHIAVRYLPAHRIY